MQRRAKNGLKVRALLPLAASALFLFIGSSLSSAAVSGPCSLCHTMHNSQDGNDQAHSGTGASWDGSGYLSSGFSGALGTLLISDCVGCHSSTSTDTLVNMFGSGVYVPIVFNTGGYPPNPLAGGNFALNSGSANIYGHNVRGISNVDGQLTQAPGIMSGCADSCHISLAIADPTGGSQPVGGVTARGGCEGCHTRTDHHNSGDSSYRFLGGHLGGSFGNVIGTEDSNWEVAPSATEHNVYMRFTGNETGPNITLGRFCAGCHQSFHATGGSNAWNENNAGDDNSDDIAGNNPWLRHPSNVNIPNAAEYADLFLGGNNAYNPTIPVAQDLGGNTNIVDSGDQVTCISCHRAHASDRPDALRFDYNSVIAHSGGNDTTTGCFYCHRTKDIP